MDGASRGEKGVPRFEESVQVIGKTPEAALQRHLWGFDLECGPTRGGAPTHQETLAVRPHQAPYVDFAAVARELLGRRKSQGPDAFFLYRLKRAEGEAYILRDAPIPTSWYYNVPGTQFELIAGFPDRDSGVAAFQRLERGFPSPTRDRAAGPFPVWSSANCRPK